jgi:AcrR family transcriptional regulator
MRGEDRRRALLAAARVQFARHGFHGAGTAAIARDAGCSEAILYRHFSSKRELLVEVLRAEVEGRLADGRAIAPPPGADPADAMAAALAARLADGEMAVTARLILLAISMSGDPEIGGAVVEAFAAVRAPLRAALAAAQDAGAVRGDIDPEVLTWLWHGLFMLAAVRNTMADDGVAHGAVDAARALSRLLAPPGA